MLFSMSKEELNKILLVPRKLKLILKGEEFIQNGFSLIEGLLKRGKLKSLKNLQIFIDLPHFQYGFNEYYESLKNILWKSKGLEQLKSIRTLQLIGSRY